MLRRLLLWFFSRHRILLLPLSLRSVLVKFHSLRSTFFKFLLTTWTISSTNSSTLVQMMFKLVRWTRAWRLRWSTTMREVDEDLSHSTCTRVSLLMCIQMTQILYFKQLLQFIKVSPSLTLVTCSPSQERALALTVKCKEYGVQGPSVQIIRGWHIV